MASSSKFGCFTLLGMLFFTAACTHTRGPQNLSSDSYEATRRAVAKLEGAGKYRNASGAIFEPKFEDVRKALEDVDRQVGNQSSDAYAATQVHLCAKDLREYRSNLDSREAVSRPLEEQLKGVKATAITDPSEVMAEDGRDFDNCMSKAKSYF